MIKVFTDESGQISYIVNIESDNFNDKVFFAEYYENFDKEISDSYHNIEKFYKFMFNTNDFKILSENFIDIACRMKFSHFLAIQDKKNYQEIYNEVCKSLWEQTLFSFVKDCKCHHCQEYVLHKTNVDFTSGIFEKIIKISPLFFLYKNDIKFNLLNLNEVIISSVPEFFVRYDSIRE